MKERTFIKRNKVNAILIEEKSVENSHLFYFTFVENGTCLPKKKINKHYTINIEK